MTKKRKYVYVAKCLELGCPRLWAYKKDVIGKKYGFEITRILVVAHGGRHNDTICTVEVKQ